MQGQRTPSALKKRQQTASDTQHLLEELKGRQEKLDQGVDALNVQLQKWVEAVHSQLDEATTTFALVQMEITTQAELQQSVSSAAQDVSLLQVDDQERTRLVKDQQTKDTEC